MNDDNKFDQCKKDHEDLYQLRLDFARHKVAIRFYALIACFLLTAAIAMDKLHTK